MVYKSEHLLEKCRYAKEYGFETLSTGERLIVALVLNRPDWLQQLGYTMVEAVDWIGHEWLRRLLQAQRVLNNE
jgi:hypothetical protein